MIHYNHLKQTIEPHFGEGMRVIFLGDQQMNLAECQDKQAVEYFGKHMDTVSIDITGENGALDIDLSKDQGKKNLPEPADIVADYGTIEHVSNLLNALKNTFNLLKVGGTGIHVNPMTGHFVDHNSFHYFSEEFWHQYMKLIKLEFVRVFTHPAYPPPPGDPIVNNEVYAIYKKTDKSKFPSRSAKAYKQLQLLIETHIKDE